MERAITDFVRTLRNAEIRVSPAETLDAMRALRVTGYADRALLKSALAATLVKTIEEKSVFDECFERYFSWQDVAQHAEAHPPSEAAGDVHDMAVPTENPPALTIDGLSPLSTLLMSNDAMQIQLAIEAAGRETGVSEMRIFTQKGLFSRRVLEQLGWNELQSDILQLEQQTGGQSPGHEEGLELQQRAQQLRDRVLEHVERNYLMYGTGDIRELRESVLRTARLSHLDQRDLERLNQLVRRIARKLAARYSQRKRRERRGLLDVPRTLRAGHAHDGILFEPKWRRERKDRPTLIAICDVSGSVSAYARFLLMFLYSLGDVLPKVRSFVFSSQLAEVSDLFNNNPPEVAVDLARKAYGYGSTDYSAALNGILEQAGRDLDGGATVIMLGDARNNYGDPAIAAIDELGRRAKRLLWLNPESESAWSTGDSEMMRYRAYCTEARVCQTLEHLERFADKLLRAP